MPRNKLLGERFKVQKFKLYLVDLRDYHNPVLVRKHLDNKIQAIKFRNKYYEKHFDIVTWKEARKYGLRDYINQQRRHKNHTAKYEYPSECITQHERQIFRNTQRDKMKKKKRRPQVTETAVWDILNDKPSLFVNRVKHYADNHWVYSKPTEGLHDFERYYSWPKDLRHLSNIIRVLDEYKYEVGLYEKFKVALVIYNKWGPRIRKYCDKFPRSNPVDEELVRQEFLARGFVEKDTLDLDIDEDSYIYSIHLKPILVHPEMCWHAYTDQPLYDYYIYDFHENMCIPGWTRTNVAGLRRRK